MENYIEMKLAELGYANLEQLSRFISLIGCMVH